MMYHDLRTSLNLREDWITNETLRQMLPQYPRLEELDLKGNEFNDDGILYVVQNLQCLKKLVLSVNKFTSIGIIALASCIYLQHLEIDDIGETCFTLESCESLSSMCNLQSLFCCNNNMDDDCVIQLSKTKTIRRLNLDSNKVGDKGAQALSQNSSIQHLSLRNNKISDKGVLAIAANTTITHLILDSNMITSGSTIELTKNLKLIELSLASNNLSDEGVMPFQNNSTLTYLDLSSNNITSIGAEFLSQNTSIKHLNLEKNKIDDYGVRALSKNKIIEILSLAYMRADITDGVESFAFNYTIKELNLNACYKLNDKGLRGLAKNISLQKLVCSSSNITQEGIISFVETNCTVNELTLLNSYNSILNNFVVSRRNRCMCNRLIEFGVIFKHSYLPHRNEHIPTEIIFHILRYLSFPSSWDFYRSSEIPLTFIFNYHHIFKERIRSNKHIKLSCKRKFSTIQDYQSFIALCNIHPKYQNFSTFYPTCVNEYLMSYNVEKEFDCTRDLSDIHFMNDTNNVSDIITLQSASSNNKPIQV